MDGDGWNDAIICDVDVELSGYNRRVHIYHNRGGTVGVQDIVLREEREAAGAGWIGVKGILEADMKGTHDAALFDIDNDGDKDLVLSRSAGTDVWRNDQVTCQADLGFGTGAVELSVCGGDLTAGNDATMALSGGPAGAPCVMFIGLTSTPTPVPGLGGAILVPLLPVLIVSFPLDGSGGFVFPVVGGQGPFSAYVQCVVVVGAGLYEVSNAVRVDMQ